MVPAWLGQEAGSSSWPLSIAAAPFALRSILAPAQPLPPSTAAGPTSPEAPTACPLGAHRVTKACGMDWWERLPGGPTMPGGAGRVQGKLLEAEGVRQAKAETKGKSSGGLQAVGVCTGWHRASRNSGEVGATRTTPGLDFLAWINREPGGLGAGGARGQFQSTRSKVLTAAGVPLRETPGKVCRPWVWYEREVPQAEELQQ